MWILKRGSFQQSLLNPNVLDHKKKLAESFQGHKVRVNLNEMTHSGGYRGLSHVILVDEK